MPSGKTHDSITFIIAVPTFVAAWLGTRSVLLASVAMGAMLFGGLMFGPDLDIHSKQYTRWGPFRYIWWPYKVMFGHRSRWSHGIVFGTLIRVVYFASVLTLLAAAGIYLRALLTADGAPPDYGEIVRAWQVIESAASAQGALRSLLVAAFAGLWWGAATHTMADVGWSMLRKGKELF